MTRYLGEANPDLAKRFGLDTYQAEQLQDELDNVDRRVKLVTFQQPRQRQDGKRDPIAYLPPAFEVYGIVDRDHAHRVSPGESWFVEVIKKTNAYFLVPLAKFDITQIGQFLPNVMDQLADVIAQEHPDELADKLGTEHEEKLETAREHIEALTDELENAREEVSVKKARIETLEAQLDEEKTKTKTIPQTTPKPTQDGAPHPPPATPTQHAEGTATREHGDILTSPILHHAAYEARFTLDLTKVHLRPSNKGEVCIDQSVEVPGLAQADPQPAPRRYPIEWSQQDKAYVLRLKQGEGIEQDPD